MIRTLLRFTLAAPLLAVGLGTASDVARVGPAAPLCAQASSTHRVGLVIEHGDGRVLRRCIGFGTTTVTALAVLQAGGVETGTLSEGALGTAICQIDNEPPTYPPSCFSSFGSYWVLFVSRGGGAWRPADVGASSATLAGGDDAGFRYDPQAGSDPPPPAPSGTCPAATPPPQATPPPAGQSPSPRPTAAAHRTPSAKPATPGTTPASGILGVATPTATAAPVLSASPARHQSPTISVGLLAAALGAGGLVGLLGVQGLRRRRR